MVITFSSSFVRKSLFFFLLSTNYRQMNCCRNWIHATPTIWNTLVMYHIRDLRGCILKCGKRFNKRGHCVGDRVEYLFWSWGFLPKTGSKIKNRWKKKEKKKGLPFASPPQTDFWEGSWKVGENMLPLNIFHPGWWCSRAIPNNCEVLYEQQNSLCITVVYWWLW